MQREEKLEDGSHAQSPDGVMLGGVVFASALRRSCQRSGVQYCMQLKLERINYQPSLPERKTTTITNT